VTTKEGLAGNKWLEHETTLLTNEEKKPTDEFCSRGRMAYIEEREFMMDTQVTPGDVTVETEVSSDHDKAVVDKYALKNPDMATGSREEFESYQGKESLAAHLERKTKVRTGREEQGQVLERDWTAFPEDDTNNFETYLDVLQAVVDRCSPRCQDTAAGSRKGLEPYEGREPLAECSESEKKALTGNGGEERNKGKRERITLDDERWAGLQSCKVS
jgi:hypothetical protein